jgi:serine protease inhibitor
LSTDAEGDDIIISSGVELVEALTQGDICKLYITLLPASQTEQVNIGVEEAGAATAAASGMILILTNKRSNKLEICIQVPFITVHTIRHLLFFFFFFFL